MSSYKNCKNVSNGFGWPGVYMMTYGVKLRVLTPFVIIYKLQKFVFLLKNKNYGILRGIYDDKWCQNSSFDTICHDIWLAKNCFFAKNLKNANFAEHIS